LEQYVSQEATKKEGKTWEENEGTKLEMKEEQRKKKNKIIRQNEDYNKDQHW
jgi:hypothetical protein